MSSPRKSPLIVGDYAIKIAPAFSTSDDLDTIQSRERARCAEEDERAAQHGGGSYDGAEGRARARAAVDASIAEARAAAAGTADIPILVRDPITGKIVEG